MDSKENINYDWTRRRSFCPFPEREIPVIKNIVKLFFVKICKLSENISQKRTKTSMIS